MTPVVVFLNGTTTMIMISLALLCIDRTRVHSHFLEAPVTMKALLRRLKKYSLRGQW
jgi:hypothetical protein